MSVLAGGDRVCYGMHHVCQLNYLGVVFDVYFSSKLDLSYPVFVWAWDYFFNLVFNFLPSGHLLGFTLHQDRG